MKRALWSILSIAALCLSRASVAQQGPPVDPEQAAREAQGAIEELTLTRVFALVEITPAQAARLVPVLEQAQTRLKEVDNQEQAVLAKLRPAAEEARSRAAAGHRPEGTRLQTVEQKVAAALRDFGGRRRRLRVDLITLIRESLAKNLTPQQLAALQEAARSARHQEARVQAETGAGSGGRGGSPVSWISRMLDRFREMPPEQWQNLREAMARGGFGAGRFGGGFGPGGDPEDPANQQRRSQFLALAERARGMSPEQYAAARADLARQLWEQSGGRGSPSSEDPAALVDWFIDRHLLHPAAVRAARRRAGLPVS